MHHSSPSLSFGKLRLEERVTWKKKHSHFWCLHYKKEVSAFENVSLFYLANPQNYAKILVFSSSWKERKWFITQPRLQDHDFKVVPICLNVFVFCIKKQERQILVVLGQLCCKGILDWKCLRSLAGTFHFGLSQGKGN